MRYSKKLFKIIKKKNLLKYKKIYPKKATDIIKLNNYVRLKILKKCINRKCLKKINNINF